MVALLLPSRSENRELVRSTLTAKGHQCLMPTTRMECLEMFEQCNVLIALGELTPEAVWVWGYSFARRKAVRAMHGVNPCMATKTIALTAWLTEIPEQMSLFELI